MKPGKMASRKSLVAVGLMTSVLGVPLAMADEPASDATDRRERAAEILQQMLPSDVATSMSSATLPDVPFAEELSRLAFENVFVQLWSRPELGLRERSLVTIGMLIAQGSENELEYHIAAGLRNGLTPEEIEEVLYHSTAYTGFPRASQATAVATRVIAREREAGNLEDAPRQ